MDPVSATVRPRIETLYQSLDTSDCGKILWERKIYILSPSIHSNLKSRSTMGGSR